MNPRTSESQRASIFDFGFSILDWRCRAVTIRTSIENRKSKIENHSRRGFTVLEVLLAFVILLVGCVSVYALFGRALISHKRAIDSTNVAVLAGAIFDDIAANYEFYYYDKNHDGVPDQGEDRNSNQVPDWFEGPGGRPRLAIPYVQGYQYTIFYSRPTDPNLKQVLFVTVNIYWSRPDEGTVGAPETFYRTVYIKMLPEAGG